MTLRASLAWSRPYAAAYESPCHLCLRQIRVGEEMAVLCRLSTRHGESTVVGHIACRHLDTARWRRDVLPGETDSMAELTSFGLHDEVVSLRAEVEGLRRANDQYRLRLQLLRQREPLVYGDATA
jgi:hypothetical protein